MREAAPNTGASASRLAALNLLVFAPIGVQLPFLPLWYASIGFAAESIALIQGATPIARFLANLLVPPLADRKGAAARLLALCGLGMTVASLCAGLVQPVYTLVFLCIVVSAFGKGPMIALTDAIVLREARRRVVAGERPLDYGVVRGAGSVSVLVLMMAGGWFVGLFPPETMIFVISGVMALAAAGVFALAPKDSRANGANVAAMICSSPAGAACLSGIGSGSFASCAIDEARQGDHSAKRHEREDRRKHDRRRRPVAVQGSRQHNRRRCERDVLHDGKTAHGGGEPIRVEQFEGHGRAGD